MRTSNNDKKGVRERERESSTGLSRAHLPGRNEHECGASGHLWRYGPVVVV